MGQESETAPGGRWVKGVSPGQPLWKAAHRILKARLQAVRHWLPLAAQKTEEDVEYVHQLRVSSRRAFEAVRVFSGLMSEESCGEIQDKLRHIRLAANEARNLDVLCGQIVRSAEESDGGCLVKILEEVRHRRREAQQPIVTTYRELCSEKFDEQISQLLEEVRSRRNGKAKRRFDKQAPRYLKPVLKKFFTAAGTDVSSDEALHNLRIRTKKLRYTMEIVAVAFSSSFRKKLYPQIIPFQDLMGMVNDHATAKAVFSDWLTNAQDAEHRAFFQGLLFAESRAHEDVRQAFLVVWTPKTVADLRDRFRKHCGLP